jgi:hypothetical protein
MCVNASSMNAITSALLLSSGATKQFALALRWGLWSKNKSIEEDEKNEPTMIY